MEQDRRKQQKESKIDRKDQRFIWIVYMECGLSKLHILPLVTKRPDNVTLSDNGIMSFTDVIINLRFFSFYWRLKIYLKWFCVVAIFVFYFSYVFYRLFTSMYCWLIVWMFFLFVVILGQVISESLLELASSRPTWWCWGRFRGCRATAWCSSWSSSAWSWPRSSATCTGRSTPSLWKQTMEMWAVEKLVVTQIEKSVKSRV